MSHFGIREGAVALALYCHADYIINIKYICVDSGHFDGGSFPFGEKLLSFCVFLSLSFQTCCGIGSVRFAELIILYIYNKLIVNYNLCVI